MEKLFTGSFSDDYIIKCTDKDVNEPWLSFLDFRTLMLTKRM